MATYKHSSELVAGDLVRPPALVRDCETDRWVPLAELWPDHPPVLVVREWDWTEGESCLESLDGSGGIDNNVLDYSDTWEIVTIPL